MEQLTHLSLFTGIGGIDLAAELAGFQTIGQCEIDPYCIEVLNRRFPKVKRWNDVTKLNGNEIVRTIGLPTLITGGFPCQPHSGAGKRKASCDSRDLWPQLRRIIREVRPKWFVGENVAGLRSSEKGLFFGGIIRDLVKMGYSVGWGSWEAAHVGAPHHRERLFIVAHTKHYGRIETQDAGSVGTRTDPQTGQSRTEQPAGSGCGEGGSALLADTCGTGSQGAEQHRAYQPGTGEGETCTPWSAPQRGSIPDWRAWRTEPNMDRVVDGIPRRVDRLKCLGNSVVPAQVYPLLKEIADYESGYTRG